MKKMLGLMPRPFLKILLIEKVGVSTEQLLEVLNGRDLTTVQLHRRRCSFFVEATLLRNGRHLIVVQVKMSALHVATSHFYDDSS